jgi:hypothetical protein
VTANASQSESRSPSRRAVLAGAIGGICAWAASALGRAGRAQAADGDPMLIAGDNQATSTTLLTNSGTGGGLHVNAPQVAVSGTSQSSYGVSGFSQTERGVWAQSSLNYGLDAFTSSGAAAMRGYVLNTTTGVYGFSGPTEPVAPKPQTGVFGYSSHSTSSRGVWGESPAGIGVYGRTTTGFAGYFQGKVFTSAFHEMIEVTTPSAPGANRARLFVRDNGAGKTQLCVRFATGSVKLIAQEA